MQFDTEYLPYLDAFIEAINDAGFTVYVAGAYREYSFQARLFNSKASQIAYEMAGGVDVDYTEPIYQEAVEEAKKITAYPAAANISWVWPLTCWTRITPAWSTAR